MSKLRLDENLHECTFKPNICHNASLSAMNSGRRTNDEFFADMKRFQDTKSKKVEELKRIRDEKEIEECKKSVSRSRMELNSVRSGLNSVRGAS